MAGSASALPVGGTGQVQFGQTAPTFGTSGTTETVTLGSNRTIVNWTDYTVNGGETVLYNFSGLDAQRAIVFNRVITPGATATINGGVYGVAGTTTASPVAGNIWLYAPGGVVIGSGAVISANGFLATTTDMTDTEKQNFLAVDGSGNATNFALGFSGPAGGGAVNVASGATFNNINGVLAFIAPSVTVGANITGAAGSDLVVGAAQNYTITLQDNGAGNQLSFLSFQVPNAAAGSNSASPVSITGALSAGSIFVAAVNTSAVSNAVVNLGGTLTATGAEAAPSNSGRIILTAGTDIANRSTGAATSGAGVTGITVGANENANGRLYGVSNGDIIVNSGTTLTADANNNATIGSGLEDLRLNAAGRLVGTGADFFASGAGPSVANGGDVQLVGGSLTAARIRGANVIVRTTSGAAEIGDIHSNAFDGHLSVDAATGLSIDQMRQSAATALTGSSTLIARNGSAVVNFFVAAGDLNVSATQNVTLGATGGSYAIGNTSVSAGQDLTIAGPITTDYNNIGKSTVLSATRDANFNANFTANGQLNITTGRDLNLGSGDTITADANSIGSGRNLVINTTGNLNASGGALLATGHGLTTGSSVYITTGGAANVNIIRGVQAQVTANGGNAVIGALGATGTTGGVNASVIASGAAQVNNLSSGQDAQVIGKNGNAWVGNVNVTRNLTVTDSSDANTAYLGGGTVGGALNMSGGSVLIDNPGLTVTSASLTSYLGDIIDRGALTVSTGDLTVNSARDADFAGAVDVAGSTSNANVTTARDVNIGADFGAGGDVNLQSSRDVNVSSGVTLRGDNNAGGIGRLIVNASGNVNATGALFAAMDPVGGSSFVNNNGVYVTAGNNVTVNSVRGAEVQITATNGAANVNAIRSRAGNVTVTSQGNANIGNIAAAAGALGVGSISVTSNGGSAYVTGTATGNDAITVQGANVGSLNNGTTTSGNVSVSGATAVAGTLNTGNGTVSVTASNGPATVGAATGTGNVTVQATGGQVIAGSLTSTGGAINVSGTAVDLAIGNANGALTVTANNNIDIGNGTGSSISITGGSVNNTGFLNATAGNVGVRANNGNAAAGDVTATGNISITATGTATARSTHAGGTTTVQGGS